MVSLKKIDILLSPLEMRNVFRKKVKNIGVTSQNIKGIKVKVIKKYIDQRSFSLVALYSLNKEKKVIGIANSDGKKEYAFKMNSLIFRYLSKIKPRNRLVPKPYCYIKTLGLFLEEYIKGKNFGEILKTNEEIENIYITRIAELLSSLQKINASIKTIEKGTGFYDIKKNIEILKQRKKKEGKTVAKIFKNLKRKIRKFEKENKNKVLVHGDFNPYNIFLEKRRAKIIDFENTHQGDRVSDIADIFSHFEVTLDFKISEEKIKKWENIFLKTYQKTTKSLSGAEEEKLRIYKAYFELLSISHIMVWGDYPQGVKLLKKLH